jgi:tRNA pseudouridine55 synthase
MTTTSDGFVVAVDKPVGPTSFDIVAALRRVYRERRVGHTGTLDPLASGLMLVCVGPATRLVPWLTDADKAYRATISLGRETVSGDLDGVDVPVVADAAARARALSRVDVAAVLSRFVGEIDQVPPAFSAIRVDGQRAHERARAGEVVEMPSRRVRIDALDLVEWSPPDAVVDVRCGKGTYVRSIGIDVGRALGVGGHLSALRRTAVGDWSVDAATPLDALVRSPETARQLTPAEALASLPAYRPVGRALDDVLQGRPHVSDGTVGLGATRALDPSGRLIAIVSCRDDGRVYVDRGFGAASA